MAALSLEEIAAKVAKLERLAAGAGTPEEAASAAAKASELMESYQITRVQVDLAAGKEQDAGYGHRDFELDNGSSSWQTQLAQALADDLNCQIVWLGKSYSRPKPRLDVIGHKESVAQLIELQAWLSEQIVSMGKDAWKREGFGDHFGWIHSYRHGVVQAIATRLWQARRDRRQQLNTEQSTALVVLSDKVIETTSKIYPKLTTRSSTSSRTSGGGAAGRRDGRAMNLQPTAKLGGARGRIG